MQRFFIIVTGWNCKPFVQNCVKSIEAQTYKNFEVKYIEDCSTDGTSGEFEYLYHLHKDIKYMIGKNFPNQGAAYHRHTALTEDERIKPDDIILFMGMDDELLPGALERIAKEYDNGKLMTYGNWINQDGNGLPADFDLEFPDSVHAERSYRKVKYRSTAPNTFRRFLYDCIKPEDLQYKGEWFKATTESEVMFSCLEQCGKDRIGVIKEPIYLYNQGREQNARRRFGIDYQTKIYNYVINKPKRELWSSSK